MTNSDETTGVVIFTTASRIEGRIALVPGARLTDFIRSAPDFVAVSEAVVFDRAGKRLFASAFVDVGRQFIELIVPAEFMTP